MNNDFIQERDELVHSIEKRIENILLSEDRMSKHKPWTWTNEDINEHLLKALRHISTHLMIREGYQKPDGEDHLDNAACRLAMAIATIDRKIDREACQAHPD